MKRLATYRLQDATVFFTPSADPMRHLHTALQERSLAVAGQEVVDTSCGWRRSQVR